MMKGMTHCWQGRWVVTLQLRGKISGDQAEKRHCSTINCTFSRKSKSYFAYHSWIKHYHGTNLLWCNETLTNPFSQVFFHCLQHEKNRLQPMSTLHQNGASKLDKKVAFYTWSINLTLETTWWTQHWPNYTSEKLSLNKNQIMLHSQISYNFCCKSKQCMTKWLDNTLQIDT